MQEYLFAAIFLIGALDVTSVAVRYEMYEMLRQLTNNRTKEISDGVWSSICTYLIPYDKFTKLSKIFPLTYLFERKIRGMLKDKTYGGVDVIKRIEYVKNLKWEDIRHKEIHIT